MYTKFSDAKFSLQYFGVNNKWIYIILASKTSSSIFLKAVPYI
jgi:hypothetical protein